MDGAPSTGPSVVLIITFDVSSTDAVHLCKFDRRSNKRACFNSIAGSIVNASRVNEDLDVVQTNVHHTINKQHAVHRLSFQPVQFSPRGCKHS